MNIQIRTWRLEDAMALANALNNKKIMDNLRDGLPFPYTEQDATVYITSILEAEPGKAYAWAITVDDIPVGSMGVFRQDNIHKRTAEMGYYISELYWGQGIGTKAIEDACKYIFEKTDIVRIFASPFSHNIASCRILEKAGFTCEGVLRKNAEKNGVLMDMTMYSIIKEN